MNLTLPLKEKSEDRGIDDKGEITSGRGEAIMNLNLFNCLSLYFSSSTHEITLHFVISAPTAPIESKSLKNQIVVALVVMIKVLLIHPQLNDFIIPFHDTLNCELRN